MKAKVLKDYLKNIPDDVEIYVESDNPDIPDCITVMDIKRIFQTKRYIKDSEWATWKSLLDMGWDHRDEPKHKGDWHEHLVLDCDCNYKYAFGEDTYDKANITPEGNSDCTNILVNKEYEDSHFIRYPYPNEFIANNKIERE